MLFALVLAVAVAQNPAAPAPKRARSAAVAIAPLAVSVAELQAAATALAMSQSDLAVIANQAPALAVSGERIALALAPLADLASLVDLADLANIDGAVTVPPVSWNQQDPADSLYRAARRALNNSQYSRAAELFHSVYERYARSTYAPNAYYWEAFALYRTGSDDALRAARTALRTQAEKHPRATTRRDAEVLMRRVQGVLAQRGDAEAAQAISEDVDDIAPAQPPVPAVAPVAPVPPVPDRAYSAAKPPRAYGPRGGMFRGDCNDEDDIRTAALNAMLQMDAERAVPILKSVLARRDTGSTCLRRKAVFLVSQKRSPETARILLDAVRSDPDKEVREQAVFWLSQVPGDETVTALDSILRGSDDPDVQDKAIFALSQHNSARSGAILRAYAERRDAPVELREKAIFWLGQRNSADNAQFLKTLYGKLENDELKEKVIFSLSQMGGADNYRWMMDIALNPNEDIEIRKKALFWAGQGRSVDVADLVRLYDSMKDREMREQLIFVYSQRREAAALDKLFDIGKNDPDRELRKKAIFWIGQSRDPRAAQFLQELINQ
jgi:HEAT repeat protein/TolA-binding protein